MINYSYKAVDKKGNEQVGIITADSYQQALDKLKEAGFYPTEMHEALAREFIAPRTAQPVSIIRKIFRPRMKHKQLVPFVSDLAVLIDAGIPLVRALHVLSKQVISPYLQSVIDDLKTDIETGQTLSDALAKHPRVFSPLFINMVHAGEIGGVLSNVLDRLALLYEKQAQLNSKIKAAMTYPLAVLFFALTVVAFMVTFIVPKFFVIFEELGTELPTFTILLQKISIFTKDFWWLFLILLFIAGIVLKFIIRLPKIRFMIDAVSLRIPLVGVLFRKVAISRFCRTFGTLRASGVPILQTLSVAKEACGNGVVEQAVEKVKDSIREGESVAAPLSNYAVFPPVVINMIAVGEETGTLSEMLLKISNRFDDDVDTIISQLTSLLEPILIIALGIIVLFIILGLFLPLVSLIESFGGA